MKAILLLIAFVFFVFYTYSQSNWEWVPGAPTYTSNEAQTISTVCFADNQTGYLLTSNGIVYKSTDSGTNWDSMSQLIFNGSQMKFLNRDTGFVLDGPFAYITTNGAFSWQRYYVTEDSVSVNIIKSLTNDSSLYCYYNRPGAVIFYTHNLFTNTVTRDTVTAPYSLFFRNDGNSIYYTTTSFSRIMHTSDSGQNWDTVFASNKYVLNVFMSKDNWGYALLRYFNSYFTIKTIDIGKTWQSVQNTDSVNVQLYSTAIHFASENTGWLCRPSAGLFETNNGGDSWQFVYEGKSLTGFTQTAEGIVYAWGKNLIRRDARLINDVRTVSEEVNRNGSFIVYPNPASHFFSVRKQGALQQTVRVKVFNWFGAVVINEVVGLSTQLDITMLPAGTYSIEISDGESKEIQKLVLIPNQ